MSVTMKAFSIDRWKVYEQPQRDFRIEGSSRIFNKVIIGTIQQPGQSEAYVIEPIYKDLIPLIKQRKAVAHVDLYSYPRVVLENGGRLIPHNANVVALRDDILDILSDPDLTNESNQIRATAELRNNTYSATTLGRATKALRNIISDEMERKINYEIIRLVLREKFLKSKPEEGSGAAEELFSLTKEELVNAYAGVLEKEKTGICRIDPVKTMLESYSLEDIKKALEEEISRRFFEGSIT